VEPNQVDLTGQTFGSLTVIERAGRNKWGQRLWRCRCLCGQECFITASELRRKKCCRHRQDVTGQTFGLLTVIERIGEKWRCRCLCGQETVVKTNALRRGNRRTCGYECPIRRENLTCQIFGCLTAIKEMGVDKEKAMWRCQCLCGKEVVVSAGNLKNGTTQSCGCKRYLNEETRSRICESARRMDTPALMKKFGITERQVIQVLRNQDRDTEIKKMHDFGLSATDIAFETGLSANRIHTVLKNSLVDKSRQL
jgi:hypothetical protein